MDQRFQATTGGEPPTTATDAARLIQPLPRRTSAELLDAPAHDPAELAANLRDIRRFNRLFGGVAPILHHLPALLARVPPDREAVVLDVATGSGDIPRAVLRWAGRRGRQVHVVASDVSEEVLTVAAQQLAGVPGVTLARYDARAVPLPDGSADIVLCSLALHHFPPEEAVAVLREMDRLGRAGFVVNDLARGRAGYAGAWLAAHALTRNRLTRHDAPLSVLRAYTPDELGGLLARAGVRGATVHRHPWFRMTAVKVGDGERGSDRRTRNDHPGGATMPPRRDDAIARSVGPPGSGTGSARLRTACRRFPPDGAGQVRGCYPAGRRGRGCTESCGCSCSCSCFCFCFCFVAITGLTSESALSASRAGAGGRTRRPGPSARPRAARN